MISTPYRELRDLLGQPDDWHPTWGQHLEVHRSGNTTVYSAHPERLTAGELAELQQLGSTGWQVFIDGPRLGKIRITITKGQQ